MKRIIITATIVISILTSCGKQIEETKPIRKDITETVFASGTLEADGTYSLTARADGYIVELNFRENEEVKKGQILALIDNKQSTINAESGRVLFEIAKSNVQPNSPKFIQAENEMLKAKQKMEYDSSLYSRYKNLLAAQSISRMEFEKIELQFNISKTEYKNAQQNYDLVKQQAEQQLIINRTQKDVNRIISDHNQIFAIKSGRVLRKFKQVGDFVRQGEAIAIIGNTEFVYAKVSIDEGSISKIKSEQDAFIQLNTNKEKVYKGTVAEILPTFDESTQSFICKVYFVDSVDFKIIGTQLQANINVGITKDALLIPRNYLGYDNEVRVKGEPKPKRISTKIVSSDWVQVLSGIDENTVLITDNIK